MKMFHFFLFTTYLSLNTSLNKNFDLFDTRLFQQLHCSNSFLEHTDVLNVFCSYSAHHKQSMSPLLVLIKGAMYRNITTQNTGVTGVGILLQSGWSWPCRSLLVFSSSLAHWVSKVHNDFCKYYLQKRHHPVTQITCT